MTVTSLTHPAQDLNWLITNFVEQVPDVAHAIVVSSDGLPMAYSQGFPPDRVGQLAAVTISFDLRPGVAIGDAIQEINRATAEMRLPATINGIYQGTAQAFQSSLRGMGILLVRGMDARG